MALEVQKLENEKRRIILEQQRNQLALERIEEEKKLFILEKQKFDAIKTKILMEQESVDDDDGVGDKKN